MLMATVDDERYRTQERGGELLGVQRPAATAGTGDESRPGRARLAGRPSHGRRQVALLSSSRGLAGRGPYDGRRVAADRPDERPGRRIAGLWRAGRSNRQFTI